MPEQSHPLCAHRSRRRPAQGHASAQAGDGTGRRMHTLCKCEANQLESHNHYACKPPLLSHKGPSTCVAVRCRTRLPSGLESGRVHPDGVRMRIPHDIVRICVDTCCAILLAYADLRRAWNKVRMDCDGLGLWDWDCRCGLDGWSEAWHGWIGWRSGAAALKACLRI